MKKKFILKNCYDDEILLTLELTNVKYIFKRVLSSDEVFTVVYKDNKVETYDSDMHFRHIDYNEEWEMIYPEQIELLTNTIEPNTKENFVKKEEI